MIGLDGCAYDLVSPWIKSGHLPNLARLIEKGAYGYLVSTIPSHSAPAWTSLTTGVNPGKHGIFDFLRRDTSVVTASNIKNPRLWTILSAHGFRCCVVNVPVTYPPDRIDGVVISGFPTPLARNDYAHPSSVLGLLEKTKYLVDAPILLQMPLYENYDRGAVLKEECLVAERRAKTVLELLQSEWDFVFVVFKECDDLQHLFWDKPDVLLEFYKKLDAYIGSIEEAFRARAPEDDVYIFVVSDHGFGPGPTSLFDLRGWIMLNTMMKSTFSSFSAAINELSAKLLTTPILGHSLGLDIVKFYQSISPGRVALFIEKLAKFVRDLRIGTPAFLVLHNGIYVNSSAFKTRQEFESFISELLEKLPKIEAKSKRVFNRIWKREDLYTGTRLDQLPELVYTTHSEFITCKGPFLGFQTPLTGAHFDCPNGTLIISGSNVNHQRVEANVYQITPTILNLFGISYSDQFDGAALQDVFANRLKAPETPKQLESMQQESMTLTLDEESVVKERLRRLGYL